MIMRGGKRPEETNSDELEAFEEWESPEGIPEEESTPAGQEPEAHVGLPEEEEPPAFAGLEVPATEQTASAEGAEEVLAKGLPEFLLDLAPDIPVNLVAVIGKTTTTVGDLMECRIGQVIDLGRPPGETVDVVANGRLIARGELVDMDGQLGVRILKMVR